MKSNTTYSGKLCLSISLLHQRWLIERPDCLEELWNKLALKPCCSPPSPQKRQKVKISTKIESESLIQKFDKDERIPYWTEIWPAGIGLAEWLLCATIKDKLCLELGCGLGLSALAGVAAGGRVVAMDYEPLALYYTAKNRRLNISNVGSSSGELICVAADWRNICFKSGTFDRIWAGDIMYERRFMAPIARLINYCLKPNGKVWIADPGRGIYPEFAKIMRENGWEASIVAWRKAQLPGTNASPADIQIWELVRMQL